MLYLIEWRFHILTEIGCGQYIDGIWNLDFAQMRKKRRLNSAGRYGGCSIAFVTRLVNDTRARVRRRLNAFYSLPENLGKQDDPALLGRFVFTYLFEERTDIA
jgi:hypothetical protein